MVSAFEALTTREIDVLRALVECGNVPATADELGLSKHTIEQHLKSIRRKFNNAFTVQIVAWAVAYGVVAMP